MNNYEIERRIVDQKNGTYYKVGDVVSIIFPDGGGNGSCTITKITDTGFHYTVGGKRDKCVQYKNVAKIERCKACPVSYEADGYADGKLVYDTAYCPNCEHEFEEDDINWECNYCPECGKKLNWQQEE